MQSQTSDQTSPYSYAGFNCVNDPTAISALVFLIIQLCRAAAMRAKRKIGPRPIVGESETDARTKSTILRHRPHGARHWVYFAESLRPFCIHDDAMPRILAGLLMLSRSTYSCTTA
jgi:hypothetical protein